MFPSNAWHWVSFRLRDHISISIQAYEPTPHARARPKELEIAELKAKESGLGK
jgi:hypothetical protein